jgi:Zn-dependent M28 family amino/carboxypeptidase
MALAVLALAVAVGVPTAMSAGGTDSSGLRSAVTLSGVRAHQQAFQNIANTNSGTRAAGTAGYDASVEYVVERLEAAGYTPEIQEFDFDLFEETAPPVFTRVSPDQTYVEEDDFATMDYSGSGDVTRALVATNDIVVPPGATASTSNSGCEASDFPSTVSNNIALVQRGTCTFRVKAENAYAAGAVGVVIFNEGQPDRSDTLFGTLDPPAFSLPVIGTSFAVGAELYEGTRAGTVTVRLKTATSVRTVEGTNVLAETEGREDRVVVVGAHLDSVPEGPGINDNGSGSATILEVAEAMADLGVAPRNQVRFAWWGAEEYGLLGSEHYVSQLTSREIKDIAVNLNFDMVGSPNFVRFVYDGDGSATPDAGPNGSGVVEDVFLDYFGAAGLATAPTAFDGRSDYGPFIEVGIPAGGLFTGAEDLKTAEEAAIFGGTAGIAHDPCYHAACDTVANVSETALDQMSDATAHAVLMFAMTTSAVPGTDKGNAKGKAAALEFKGSRALR